MYKYNSYISGIIILIVLSAILLAFSLGKNERYYPINNDKNDKLYNKYLRESKKLNNVYFFGRLGDYKYYNMDLAVERVLKLFKEIFKWF